MKAKVQFDALSFNARVWIYEQSFRSNDVQVLKLDGTSVPSWVEHDGSSRLDADPTLVLPIGALEALVKAASDVLPANDATVDALKDAREVRDRTFGLLEKVVTNERNT